MRLPDNKRRQRWGAKAATRAGSAPLERRRQEALFEALKARLLLQVLGENPDPLVAERVRYAANDAAALAWSTQVGLLLLPLLLEEKITQARRQAEHQALVLKKGK